VAVDLDVTESSLCVRIRGWDALFALSRGMTIPLSSVRGIAVAPRRRVPATGLRLPGTGFPGVIRAGSYGTGDRRDFWLVRRAAEVLVIELEPGEPYRRIVLELADPREVCLRLRPHTGAYTGTFTDR
jgi:hypothetical protein